MKQIYWLDRILPSQRLLVGDKAFALSELSKQDYPILNGFVIEATTVREFLKISGTSASFLADFCDSLANLDVKNHQELQSVARKTRQQISQREIAGSDLDPIKKGVEKLNCANLIWRTSFLLPKKLPQKLNGLFPGIISAAKAENIDLALKLTWEQLFSAKSIFFWDRVGINIDSLSLAILVQPITSAIASGSIEIDRDFIQVRSSWGLGHSLVKGEVLPDYYRIPRAAQKVDRRELGIKMRAYRLAEGNLVPYLLTEAEQAEYSLDRDLLNLAIAISDRLATENNYLGCLEWTVTATEVPKFYITESVPDLDRSDLLTATVKEPAMNRDRVLLKGLAASPGVAIAAATVIGDRSDFIPHLAPKTILVTKNISENWFPVLKQAAGVVAEEGGVTSHAAIIARELGIPAVVGATNARKILANGQLILLNGTKGEISALFESQVSETSLNGNDRSYDRRETALFNYPLATKLYVNLSQPSSIANAVNLPVDGVGLLRSELMLLDLLTSEPIDVWLKPEKQIVLSEYITESLAQFAAAFAPRPVFYRSLDWRSFELNNSGAELATLSLTRGTYNYTIDPILFDLELEALVRVKQAGYNNLSLILPFVRSVEEFIFCRQRIKKKGLFKEKSFQLWIMAEVPSVLFLLSEYVEAGVKGISIGTNDLTELILGTNRDRSEFKSNFTARHPAMLKVLEQLIKTAKKLGISCSICGQAPAEYPEAIEQLVNWGIDSISVEPQAVAIAYQKIARAEQRLILNAARSRLSAD